MGLNLTLGYAGQISLAQAAFVGIGAYITALLTTHGWPFWSTYLIAAVVCFVLAALPVAAANRFPGGAFRLVALGLGLWLWPLMWVTTKAAF